jgi:outer membrane protein insertion porin family
MKLTRKFSFLLVAVFCHVGQCGAVESQKSAVAVAAIDSEFLPEGVGSLFKCVSLVDFEAHEGLRVRRIEITGNEKTRDDVILKQLSFSRGSVLKSADLKDSIRRVEALGCFIRNSIYWKIHKISDERADLELVVQERIGGTANLVGGGVHRLDRLYSHYPIGALIEHPNTSGRGDVTTVECGTAGSPAGLVKIAYYIPCIAGSDVSCGFDAYYKSKEQVFWSLSYDYPRERIAGAAVCADVFFPEFDCDVKVKGELGCEQSHLVDAESFERQKRSYLRFYPQGASDTYSEFAFDRVQNLGAFAWAAVSVAKDTRNHVQCPSEGMYLVAVSKLGFPQLDFGTCFVKNEACGCFYFPLIGEEDVVLALRAAAGSIHDISGAAQIPYRELYQIGSQDSVRGAMPGYAGPLLMGSDVSTDRHATPLGALYYTVCNVELRKPLSVFPSWGLRARVFYDAGCGFGVDTKNIPEKTRPFLRNTDFNVRHVAGVGMSIGEGWFFKTNIDVGWKLDRNASFQEVPFFVYGGLTASW